MQLQQLQTVAEIHTPLEMISVWFDQEIVFLLKKRGDKTEYRGDKRVDEMKYRGDKTEFVSPLYYVITGHETNFLCIY